MQPFVSHSVHPLVHPVLDLCSTYASHILLCWHLSLVMDNGAIVLALYCTWIGIRGHPMISCGVQPLVNPKEDLT